MFKPYSLLKKDPELDYMHICLTSVVFPCEKHSAVGQITVSKRRTPIA